MPRPRTLGSNQRPLDYLSDALPIELIGRTKTLTVESSLFQCTCLIPQL